MPVSYPAFFGGNVRVKSEKFYRRENTGAIIAKGLKKLALLLYTYIYKLKDVVVTRREKHVISDNRNC